MSNVSQNSTHAQHAAAGIGRILLVDDDAGLQVLVARLLQRQGYQVIAVSDGRTMRSALTRYAFDLILLDLMLPDESGVALCRELRTTSDLPVIMLTARGGDGERVGGFEAGADDYVTKPFNPDELLARVRAVMRRARGHMRVGSADGVVTFDGWSYDTRRRELTSPASVLVDLSTGEADLLAAFIDNANAVISRETLMAVVKTRSMDPFDRTIDVQVSRLRRKLSTGGGEDNRIIKTVRGAGYVFVPKIESLPS